MPQTIDDYGSYDIPVGDSTFLKLENGDNKIRLVSKPVEVILHQTSEKGKPFATAPCQGEKCELCAAGKKKNYKYGYLVLSRKDGKPYIFEAPITVFRQIVGYATNEEYGDPMKYDLTIKKEGTAPQVTYTVIASPKQIELTKEEKEIILSSNVSLETAYADTEKK